MPSSFAHETVVDMFRHRPGLAAELLTGLLGVAVPEHRRARLGAAEVTELRPSEHRADTVVVLSDPVDPVGAVVVEVQMRPDDDKPWVWPEYVTGVRRRLRCPTVLLVVCRDGTTAAWAAEPIELGGGSRLVPHVLGPDRIPALVASEDAARTPELAVLSVLVHVTDDGPYAALDSLVVALDHVHTKQAVEYARLVLSELPALARGYLEELMATETYEYQSAFTRRLEARGEERGEVKGRALLILRLLDARGIAVPAEARERIIACTDADRLDAWGVRVLTATTVEELFT